MICHTNPARQRPLHDEHGYAENSFDEGGLMIFDGGLDGASLESASLDAHLSELSWLAPGGVEGHAPQFLQEMPILQMQAEAWRMQWSAAMKENEELHAQLYGTRSSLEAAGGGGGGGEHWRELCISIAKSAEDEIERHPRVAARHARRRVQAWRDA